MAGALCRPASSRILPNTCDIRAGAFARSGLEEIVLPKDNTEIQSEVFRDCRRLKNVYIPENTEAIWEYALAGTALERIALPKTVEVIGEGAFLGMKALTSIEIQEHVREIGKSAFAFGSDALTISVSGDNSRFFMDSSLLTDRKERRVIACAAGMANKAISVSEDIHEIGDCAFAGNAGIREISLPYSLKKIGDWAFREMDALEKLEIKAENLQIGEDILNQTDIETIIASERIKDLLTAEA